MRMKRSVAILSVFSLLALNLSFAGLGSDKAMYVGGTISTLKEKTEGRPELRDSSFVFSYEKATFSIPYAQINSLEYGQKAGRRLGMAIVISPLFIFSHKRKHFMT